MREPLVVIHRYTAWLNLTLTWLHRQIASLPPDIESHVVYEASLHDDRFRLPHLHGLDDEPRWRNLWERGTRKLGLRRHLPFVVRVARRHHAKILHSHFGNVAWSDLGAAKAAGLKHIVTFYGADVNSLPHTDHRWYRRYRELFDRVDRVLCEGPHMRSCLLDLGCPPEKALVHPLGIDLSRFPHAVRERRPDEPLRVLIAGTFREKKGIPDALTALGRVKRRRPDIPLAITLIGDAAAEPASQRERDRIHAIIREHDLPVDARGYCGYDELIAAYYAHHVFLSPSVHASNHDTEGGAPVALLEAAASGMPILSTFHCDIPHLLPDGEGALLVPERSPDALADRLIDLADHPERWAPLGRSARARVLAHHDADQRAAALADIYRSLV